MALMLKRLRDSIRKAPLIPLPFPTTGFRVYDDSGLVEEENFCDEFNVGHYYPMNIGDVVDLKYQVLGNDHGHVALKVYTREHNNAQEFRNLNIIASANKSHPGYQAVRTARELIKLPRSGGDHECLVQVPMWESFKSLLERNLSGRFNDGMVKGGLHEMFKALDYLHSDCKLIHTDIKADNILMGLNDPDLLHAFEDQELAEPSARQLTPNGAVYVSRRLGLTRKFGLPVLSDFGTAIKGDVEHNEKAQPDVYRSPEIMLGTGWSYPADIWNLGVMIWDIFEGGHLFYGMDPTGKGYSTRAHLAEVISLLGAPPKDFLDRATRNRELFTEEGIWSADVPIRTDVSLEDRVTSVDGESKQLFMNMVRGMLQWRPEERKTAKELINHPWLSHKGA